MWKITRFAKEAFLLAAQILMIVGNVAAQAPPETWSLERCVKHAIEQNLLVKQAQASVRAAEVAGRQAKASRLPGVNANTNLGEQFGRTIDPTTNQFVNTGVGFNSLNLSAGISLFNGGQIHHNVRRAEWERQAAWADMEQNVNTLSLQVAQAYLAVLLSEEQLSIARSRLAQSRQQAELSLKLIEAGNLPAADRFNLDAQIARDEQALVQVQNNVALSYLNLKQLLMLEPDYPLALEKPSVAIPDDDPATLSFQAVYAAAQGNQPNVKAAAFRLRSAEEGIAVAKSAYYPRLTAFAQLTTNYSTQFRDFKSSTATIPVTQNVQINGEPAILSFNQTIQIPEIRELGYFEQIERNFGQAIGLQLSIPIYQNGAVRLNAERARIGVVSAQLQQNQTLQQLKNDVQVAIANAQAAQRQYRAAQKTYEAFKMAFENAQKRFNLGAANSFEITTAQNNLNIAENDLISARYDYLFRLKIIDFYLGKPLDLR
ncbi:MAG: TolC family protein [Saprospiraceae bacterium]